MKNRTGHIRQPNKTHQTLLGTYEARLTDKLTPHIPSFIQPHYLTIASFIGFFFVGLSYIVSSRFPWMLLVANIGIVLNWIGDNFDGSVARYRRKVSNFGLYQDHMIDALSVCVMCIGITISNLTLTPIWLFIALLFLLLEVHAVLRAYIQTQFIISFGPLIGPIEERILIIIMNISAYAFYERTFFFFGTTMTVVDAAGFAGVFVMTILIITEFFKTYRQLYRKERKILE